MAVSEKAPSTDVFQWRTRMLATVAFARKDPMQRILSLAGVLVLAMSATTPAQWLNYKTPGVPRTSDGKPKLDAPAARRRRPSGSLRRVDARGGDGRRVQTSIWRADRRGDQGGRAGMEIGTQHKYGLAGSFRSTTACRRTSATRLDDGSATRSSSRQRDSTTRPCSTRWVMRTATSCA